MMRRIGRVGLLGLALMTQAADVPLAQQQARVSPAWITDGVMYQLWLRAFTPEGTLKAAEKRLPQVAAAGVTIIYLSPINLQDDDMRKEHWAPRQRKTDNPRNPYRIKDHDVIDPEYGSEEDLRTFVKEAHRLGMRVLMDLVYLHCGPTAVIIERHPDFMLREPDGKLKMAAWGFPGIDFKCPGVHEYFWKNMEHWVRDFDVDGFRCDVADGSSIGSKNTFNISGDFSSLVNLIRGGGSTHQATLGASLNPTINFLAENGVSRFKAAGHLTFISNEGSKEAKFHHGGTMNVKVQGLNSGDLKEIPYG